MKICVSCKKLKNESDFAKENRVKDGRTAKCKKCLKTYQREWRKKQLPDYNIKRHLKGTLKYRYGVTQEQYNEMFARQCGCCMICGRHQSEFKVRLCVDHDHETDEIRGLLCISCNRGIGYLQDNIEILKNAIEYLKG